MTATTTTATDTATTDNTQKTKHYIFGYGSLMCPHSRSITVPNLVNKNDAAHPVLIKHLKRTWTARCTRFLEEEKGGMVLGWTAMGIQFQQDAECTGVLIEVDDEELAKFDIREGGYNRTNINLEHVHPIPNLPFEMQQHYSNHKLFRCAKAAEGKDSMDSKEENEEENKEQEAEVNIWVYVQQNPKPANSSYPIPQSYVDIIVRGCLSVSPEFAKQFLETTYGWWCDDDNYNNEQKEDHHTWVNDRHVPMYVRADPTYSQKMGKQIDEMLQEYHGNAFMQRKDIDCIEHYKVEKHW